MTVRGRRSRSGKERPTARCIPPTPRRSWRNGARCTASRTSPTLTQSVSGYPRQVWHDAQGREAIDCISITGMGHGTPIATGGSGGDGTSGPFMLDVGLSSTFHIARSWKLTVDDGGRQEMVARQAADASAGLPARSRSRAGAGAPGNQNPPPPEMPPRRAAGGIGKIIEDALRSAGLMPK